ncbi:MAG: histidine kinase [Candidatus Shapirobacteria bacterium]
MGKRRKAGQRGWFAAAETAAVLGFLVLALVPFVFILAEGGVTLFGALGGGGGFPRGFGYYLAKVTWNSLSLAGIVVAVSVSLGLPAAMVLSRIRIPGAALWYIPLSIPLAAPSLVTAVVIRGFFDQSGLLAGIFGFLGLATPSPYGLLGMAMTQIFHALPYTILLVAAGFSTVPREIEEQAYSLGAGKTKTTFSLILPYIFPHILAAATMSLLFSLGDLGGALILGGGYKVFSLEIFVNFISNWGDKRIPALFGLWATMIFFLILLAVARLDRKIVARGQKGPPAIPDERMKPRILGTVYILILTIILIYPYLQVFGGHFFSMSPAGQPAGAMREALFPDLKPVWSTLILAGLAAPLTIGTAILISDWIKSRKRGILLPGLMLSPTVIPGVIVGFGFLKALGFLPPNGTMKIWQLIALVLALACRGIPFVFIVMQAALNATSIPLEESAGSLGASRWNIFKRITLPSIQPFVAVALLVSVFTTLTELSATLVLYPPGWRTMSVYVSYYIEEGFFGRAIGMSFLMLVLVEFFVLAAGGLFKNGAAKGGGFNQKVFLAPFSMLAIDKPKTAQAREIRMVIFLGKIRKKIGQASKRRIAEGGKVNDRGEIGEIQELRRELAQAELKLLRMQINPHFFFNTLNTIVHLIGTDKETAIGTVGKLSSLFRYTLDVSEKLKVPFAKEAEYLKSYLEIEKLRFGDKLQYSFEFPSEVMDVLVHPMLIQPIVENAVRYGKDDEDKAYVVIRAKLLRDASTSGASNDDDTQPSLEILVIDYGSARVNIEALRQAPGTGLRNVERRLKNLSGEGMEFSRNDPQGLVVKMKLA